MTILLLISLGMMLTGIISALFVGFSTFSHTMVLLGLLVLSVYLLIDKKDSRKTNKKNSVPQKVVQNDISKEKLE